MATYKSKQTTVPALAVTVADAKTRLVLDADFTEHDAMVEALINTATEMCQAYSGHKLMQHTVRFYFDAVPSVIRLDDAYPVIAVVIINYIDAEGAEKELTVDDYVLDLMADPVTITIINAPTTTTAANAVNVFWVDVLTGYGTSGDGEDGQRAALPAWAVQAIHVQVGSMYEQREDKMLTVGNTAGNGTLLKASEYIMHPFKRHW